MNDLSQVHLLSINDLVLVPILGFILFSISRYIWLKKLKKIIPFRYIYWALLLRLLGCGFNLYLAEYYYKGIADTVRYYDDVTNLRSIVIKDTQLISDLFTLSNDEIKEISESNYNYWYISDAPTPRVSLIALPFSFLFFNSYLCISFCFAFFCLIGCLCLYKFFYSFYPQLSKQISIATLFLPSIFFWTSSFGKDPLSFGGMCFFVYYIHKLFFITKNKLSAFVLMLLSAYCIFEIKPYILGALLPTFLILVLLKFQQNSKSSFAKLLAPIFVILLIPIFYVGNNFVNGSSRSDVQRYSSDKVIEEAIKQSGYVEESAGSNFSLGAVSPNISENLIFFPLAIITGLFRPFPWEIKNFLMVFTSLENLYFLYLTITLILKLGFFQFFQKISRDPVLIFCLSFSLLFISLVTLSTNNFGTLARYRIPILPFYLMTLFILQNKTKKKLDKQKNELVLNKQGF